MTRHPIHWSYIGDTGPEHWGDLAPEFAACKLGRSQSPVHITHARTTKLDALKFDLHASPLHIVNDGHTIQANHAPGSFLSVGRDRYELEQLHFHKPSGHKINGVAFPMEAHAVFRGESGQRTVVAVFLDASPDNAPNALLQILWKYMPEQTGGERSPRGVTINLTDLLPEKLGYYTYEGSLTTPPCTEGVRWFILREPMRVTPQQIARFGALYPCNARPLQPLNGRELLTDSD